MSRPITTSIALFSLCLTAPAARAADLNFCWVGANGYTMRGAMQVPDAAMAKPIITEDDVTAFKISGYHLGRLLGTWSLEEADPFGTWHLRFDTERMTFLTGGAFPATKSQGWNANGAVTDCGSPGFGFNSGSNAQDICVNGRFIHESSIPPDTPLTATTLPMGPTCDVMAMSSKAQIPHEAD